jgi:predicted outer membrane repeat protein
MANASSGDTLTLTCSTAWSIAFTSQITVSTSVTLDASGSPGVITFDGSSAGNYQGLFAVDPDISFGLTALTLTNGDANEGRSGGAIDNAGNLTITACTFSANGAAGNGGAINNTGTATIISSTFVRNHATNGGAIYNTSLTLDANDEWLLTSGTLTITGSTFGSELNGNQADGGGAIGNAGGTVTISSSTFARNRAFTAGGGAIRSVPASASMPGVLAVTATTFSRNEASPGGALYTSGTATITSSTFNENSTGVSATSTVGGAIANGGTLTITGSTISGNFAAIQGGGISNFGTTSIGGTILAGNTAGGGGIWNCSGTAADLGYNLTDGSSSTGDCGLTGPTDLTSTDPQLGALAQNGGPTATMALAGTSPAVDQIPSGDALCLATDQRGYGRPTGAACEIGAYEYGAITPTSGSLFSAIATII